MEPIVQVSGVSKSYLSGSVETPVLRGVSLDVAPGSFTVILGASGSGKTTLLNLLGALDSPDEGSIQVSGIDLGALNATGRARYRRDTIGFIFQFYNLLPTLTAQENVEVALELTSLNRNEVRARSWECLNLVGLSGKNDKYPSQLSGGEQQRVAVARALVRRPALILADEPTGNLDATTGQQVIDLMRSLQHDRNLTVIAVTHNERLAAAAEHVVRIESGQIKV